MELNQETLYRMNKLLEPPKLSPYKYMSTLDDEEDDDYILSIITEMTDDFLINGTRYIIDDILAGIEFVQEKIQFIHNIMDSLKMPIVYQPFINIGHSLDVMTVQEDVKFDYRSNHSAFIQQCNHLLAHLETLEKILYAMYEKDENESND